MTKTKTSNKFYFTKCIDEARNRHYGTGGKQGHLKDFYSKIKRGFLNLVCAVQPFDIYESGFF